jgi:DNA-binding XRE family transcriptional regulator
MGVEDHRTRRDFPRDLRDSDRTAGDAALRVREETAKNTKIRTEFGAEEIGEYRPRPVKELTDKWMKDPAFREAYESTPIEFLLMLEISSARARSGLTQAEIAKRMGTTQSAVARLETERLPSLRTLKRYAEAVGAKLVVKLEERG